MAETKVSVNAAPHNIVYKYLKNQILTMELCPGDKLSENKLSADMDVGRPLVRDALSQLEEEGYIVVYPQRGTEVARIDLERVRQTAITHNVFEQSIVKELCRMELTPEQNEELDEILYSGEKTDRNHKEKRRNKEQRIKKEEKKDDTLEIMMIEQQLKRALAKMCGRECVWDMYRTMDCDMMRVEHLQHSAYNYRSLTFALTGREYAQVEWRMLVDNIRCGRAEEAALVCSSHYNTMLLNAESLRRIFPQYFTE